MTRMEPDRPGDETLARRRARGQAAVSRIRAKAKTRGLDRLTMDQIDAIIADARRGGFPGR